MKRRIYCSLCGLSIVVAFLTAAICLFSFFHTMMRQARDELALEYEMIERGLTGKDTTDIAYLETVDRQFFRTRLTLVDRTGNVLYDSTGASNLGDHSARPEITAAFSFGMGEAMRASDTSQETMYYYARRIDGNHVLRVAKPAGSVSTAFFSMLPALLGILSLIAAVSILLSSRLTRLILHPIAVLAQDMESGAAPEYEELQPFFRTIREQNGLIRRQMLTLRKERDTVSAITSNMQEGLILLDTAHSILSVNKSALALLGAPYGSYEGMTVLALSRNAELEQCICEAAQGVSAQSVIERDGQYCRVMASPVPGDHDSNCGICVLLQDVTEQMQSENMRREFTANVSHELKTPLTTISGFAELMRNGMVKSEEDVMHFAGKIHHEAQRLISLTDDIIRLSRIEAGGSVEREAVELHSLCERIAKRLSFQASQKEVSLSVSGEAVTIEADVCMMEELVSNLADNAVKYNHTGGHVELKSLLEGGHAILVISDDGIGIPKEHQDRIFERFYRVDKSRSKQTGGTGLGLSIVRHIVERHGGTVSLASEAGCGTRITVFLPLK